MRDVAALPAPQRKILEILRSSSRTGKRAPSFAEIAEAQGWASTRAVGYHVEQLEKKGYLRRGAGHRNLEVVDDGPDDFPPTPGGLVLPLFPNKVAAGDPIEPFDNPPEWIDFGKLLGGEGKCVFRVTGDSMTEERIFDGDLVVFRPDPAPPSGETVIARVNGALTVKKLRRRGREVRLEFCNGEKRSFPLDPARGDEVLGRFVAAVRPAR